MRLIGFASQTYPPTSPRRPWLRGLDDAPVDSLDDFYEQGTYHEKLTALDRIADGPDDPFELVEYWEPVEA